MKHINLKRFASTALAGVLALGLVIPAAAEDKSTVITGEYEPITLAVTVTPNGDALINPYGLPITLDDDESVISGEQITTAAPLTIANQSEVDLKVTAKVSVTPTGATKIVATEAAVETATQDSGESSATLKKNVWVNFEAFVAPSLTEDNWDDEDVIDPLFAALKSEDAVLKKTLDSTAYEAEGSLVLRKGDDEEIQGGGVAFVRLSGKVAKTPAVAWAEADGFTATIVYTFEPDTYAMTLNNGKSEFTVKKDTSIDLSVDLPADITVKTGTVAWSTTGTKAASLTVTPGASTATSITAKADATATAAAGTLSIVLKFEDTAGAKYSFVYPVVVTS